MKTSDSTKQSPDIIARNVLTNHEVQSLDHLGLVAAAIESLKLVERIDIRLPMKDDSETKVTHGQRVKAMIINGLGYTSSPLYITPTFYENKDVSRLIGPGVLAEHLNDYALGRTLDAIFSYGTTQLFAEIAFEVAQERALFGKSVHIDTTTLMLRGVFLAAEELASKMKELPTELTDGMNDIPNPARGHSKAHRYDLKQVVMSLTTTGPAAMPLWYEGLSGNSSDKTNFHDSIAKFKSFKSHINLADDFLWVADSALYTKDKLQASLIKWLTRVPQTKTNAKTLVDLPDKDISWQTLENGYKAAIYNTVESGEKWVLYYSKQAYKKELISFENRLTKAFASTEKSLRQLCKEPFDCKQDALNEAKKWAKKLKYYCVEFKVQRIERYSKRGKPAKGTKPDIIEYKLSGTISDNQKALAVQRNRLGRFILASNDINNVKLTPEVMLSTYKEQQYVERGFRFIKSNEFHLDGIYLKLPSRIDALMMIMTLSLMVYNTTEYQMREALAVQEETLPNQKGKPTARPTLRWVFQLMQGVHTRKLEGMQEYVAGKNEIKEKIIRLFGSMACAIYQVQT